MACRVDKYTYEVLLTLRVEDDEGNRSSSKLPVRLPGACPKS